MDREIKLYSFADVDRSGKVRWAACELGYEVEEKRVAVQDYTGPEYRAVNPYATIPAVVLDGETWIESNAICIMLAERHPEAGLIPVDPERRKEFWQFMSLASSTLELPAVNYFLGLNGVADERWPDLVGEGLRMRIGEFASRLPGEDYLCGDFSLADICAGYVLRVALQGELLPYAGNLATYMDRLRARPAAIASRVFAVLDA